MKGYATRLTTSSDCGPGWLEVLLGSCSRHVQLQLIEVGAAARTSAGGCLGAAHERGAWVSEAGVGSGSAVDPVGGSAVGVADVEGVVAGAAEQGGLLGGVPGHRVVARATDGPLDVALDVVVLVAGDSVVPRGVEGDAIGPVRAL